MFTIKATYRNETRKISFSEHITFPTFTDIQKQLYRVFPLNDSYHLSKLLFSPDAFSAARILLANEVHDAEAYQRALAQFHGRTYANALLRFSVYDDTPHKPRSTNAEMDTSYSTPVGDYSFATSSTANDRRPAVPPKPPGVFDQFPFDYISSLSHTSPISRHSSRRSNVSMDVDNATVSDDSHRNVALLDIINNLRDQLDSARSALADITPNASSGALNVDADLQASLESRRRDAMHRVERKIQGRDELLNRLFDTNNPRRKPSPPSVSTSPVIHANVRCDACQKTVVGIRHKCLDCPDYDLCTPCISQGGAESHNPFHEFFDIKDPGRVVVHTVYDGPRPPAAAATPPARAPATHNARCDICNGAIVGSRYKCLGCRDFDTCETCFLVTEEAHPGHSFVRLDEPTAYIRRGSAIPVTAAAPEAPVAHNALCDLCDSYIAGQRYKCLACPDFDTCGTCFPITQEQHPGHSFIRMDKPDAFVRRGPTFYKGHYATCNSCSHLVRGVRYKCLHPDCPDYDLCQNCEALPIPVHPENHPMVKLKTSDVAVPTVYRVGGTEMLPSASSQRVEQGVPSRLATPRPADTPAHSERSFVSLWDRLETFEQHTAQTREASLPDSTQSSEEEMLRSSFTDQPTKGTSLLDGILSSKEEDSKTPFADPPTLLDRIESPPKTPNQEDATPSPDPPDIAPIDNMTSLASSFEATVIANIIAPSPSPPVSYPEPFGFPFRQLDSAAPSFVEDLFTSRPESKPASPHTADQSLDSLQTEDTVDMNEKPLAKLLSSNNSLIALVESEPEAVLCALPSPTTPVQEETPVPTKEASPVSVPAPLSATFITDVTVTDGQVFPPGAEFVKCWRMVNDSARDWPEGTELVFVAGESLVISPSSLKVKVGSVKAGAEVDLWTGEMKAPDVGGKYVGYWRLRGEDGNVFGNSIWIEINVAEADNSSDDSASLADSSIIMMPRAGASLVKSTTAGSTGINHADSESTVGGGSVVTISSSTEDGNNSNESDIENDSDVSLVDLISSDDEDDMGWEDARSQATAAIGTQSAAASARSPSPNAAGDFVVLYDESESESDL